MKLVYIYGPPAAGKLTVATELAQLTGFKLFHNHLTMDAARALFEYGSDPLVRVLHRVRLDIMGEAAREGIDLIFTNANHRPKTQPRPSAVDRFAADLDRIVGEAGGEVCRVQLRPPPDILLARVAEPSRTAHGKLVDYERMRDVVIGERELYDVIEPTGLRLDNSDIPPAIAAATICHHFGLPRLS